MFELKHGDCLDVLRTMADNSIDAIVTDPPYGLSFMGKRWDYDVPDEAVWRECLRVLKPGGHLLAFAGTRTQHRMAVRIEDAGFEIRDMIAWVYAQGFPKSHNLKNIFCDCGRTEPKNHYICSHGTKEKPEPHLRPLQDTDISAAVHTQDKQGQVLQSELQKQSTPDQTIQFPDHVRSGQSCVEGWRYDVQEKGELHGSCLRQSSAMGESNGEERRLHYATSIDNGYDVREVAGKNGSCPPLGSQPVKQQPRKSGTLAEQRLTQKSGVGQICYRCGKQIAPYDVSGWGTALKPALEPITVARKPIVGTVANNVMTWGTGGINVDGCRVEIDIEQAIKSRDFRTTASISSHIALPGAAYDPNGERTAVKNNHSLSLRHNQSGRFPANLIHDGSEEAVLGMGESSRYFYCAKASKRDRDEGCEGMEAKPRGQEYGLNAGGKTAQQTPHKHEPQRNHHPTVKPTDLMRYLCRLVTPPNGTVLDPFMGSGSTGKAAILEGFRFIGIEREAEYLEIARARIDHVTKERNLWQS
jgi:DNA modification methylase